MKEFRTLDDLPDVAGKNVVVRADLDVPIQDGEVTSTFRIQRAAITIRELMERKARVIVLAHLGRPKDGYDDKFSLMPVRFELGKALDTHVKFAHLPSCKNSIIFMEDAEVLLLENMRFDPAETSDDATERAAYIEELAGLADFYVNDAFGSYLKHASTYDIATKVNNPVAGRQLIKEVEIVNELRENPKKPFVAVIGGAKLDTKIEILDKLTEMADTVLIGGAMSYTLMKAQGISVGDSKVQDEMIDQAKAIIEKAKQNNCELFLPADHICGAEFSKDAEPTEVDTQQIPDGMFGLDIGEKTLALYLEKIKSAQSILWNGPMGVMEWENFSRGTEAVGEYIALTASRDTFKVAGGGDTVAAMESLKINFKNFNHVSTGGGALLTMLAEGEFDIFEPLYK